MTTICEHCHLPGDHDPSLQECVAAQAEAMRNLLTRCAGQPIPCAGCGAPLYFVRHANGARTPYTAAGLNHFIDCPKAKNFNTRGK